MRNSAHIGTSGPPRLREDAKDGPMQRRNLLISVAFAGTALALPREAAADTSSWLTAGGGYGLQYGHERDATDRATVVTFSAGVGTTRSTWGRVCAAGRSRRTTATSPCTR